MKKIILFNIIFLTSLVQWSCEDVLEVRPPSELDKGAITTEQGITALLFSSYRQMQNSTPSRWLINNSEVNTDIGFNSGGTEFLTMSQIINFTWDASLGTFQADVWSPNYRSIRDANLVLENLPAATVPEETKKLLAAEARLLRALAYETLYKWFGPVPLRTSISSPPQLERATDEEMRTFIETELLAAILDLPDPGQEAAFGRANKGMGWAILSKYYLNTKQWQKASDAATNVIDFNYYTLFADATKLFTVANEGNKEMILVIPCLNIEGYGNWYTAGALPPNFKTSAQIPEYVWVPGMANFATQYRLRSAFVNSFDFVNDKRAALIIRSYTNLAGANVNLMATPDNARCLKYWDNATAGNHSGNDVPVIRYADILLTKAEALNELNGPTQESLDLINAVRARAGIAALTLADATSTEIYRDLILRERGWEFVAEGKRREDLLRHGKFISLAQARGIAAASEKHKLYPIPQAERDANKLCGQNDGY
jgi:starch-binding outer membrane protein, SusD/RagB family